MDRPPAGATLRPSRRAFLAVSVLAALAAAAALAGCSALRQSAPALTDEEAHARVADALAAGIAALDGESTDGSLRGVKVVLQEGDLHEGPNSIALRIDYGKDEVVRFRLGGEGGLGNMTLTCADRIYLVVGDDTSLASRPLVADSEGSCLTAPGSYGSLTSNVGGFQFLKTARPANVTQARDGSLHAEMAGERHSLMEIDVDPKGHVQDIRVEASEGRQTMSTTATFDYGPRPRIDVPTEFKLMPAGVDLSENATDEAHTWTVAASPQEPPLSDLEVQLWDVNKPYEGHTDAPAHDGRHALYKFDLLDGREQPAGNWTFRFRDIDGDGFLSAGDSYEVRAGGDGNGTAAFPYQAVLFDRLAGGEVNSGFDMAPSPAWLALAALGLGLAARRRA